MTSRPAEQIGEPPLLRPETSVTAALPSLPANHESPPAEPTQLPPPPHTGDDLVDAALESLSGVAEQPLLDQLTVYDRVHRTLQDRLADVEG